MAVLQEILPLKLIEEIVGVALVAEEQPAFPGGAERRTVLDERAERRDPRPGADHDDGRIAIVRQAEILVRLDENRNVLTGFRDIREEGGADTFP